MVTQQQAPRSQLGFDSVVLAATSLHSHQQVFELHPSLAIRLADLCYPSTASLSEQPSLAQLASSHVFMAKLRLEESRLTPTTEQIDRTARIGIGQTYKDVTTIVFRL